MKVKNIFIPFILFFILISFFYSSHLLAREPLLNVLDIGGVAAGYNTPESDVSGMLDTTTGLIIAVVLGFLGVIFLVIIIYSGFQWMTAGGNEETIAKAKKRLTNATIGLVIIISGFVISYFVITQLSNITNPGTGGGGQP
jgi:hypothetical protein